MTNATLVLRLAAIIAIAASLVQPIRAQIPPGEEARKEWAKSFTTVESVEMRIEQIRRRLEEMKREDKAYDDDKVAREADANGTPIPKRASFDQAQKIRMNDINAGYLRIEKMRKRFALEDSLRAESELLVTIKQRMESAPVCSALFLSTIDKKASDLTVRETETISACKAMELYRE